MYLGLILIYCTVVVVYLIASFIINTMVACAVSTLKIHKKDINASVNDRNDRDNDLNNRDNDLNNRVSDLNNRVNDHNQHKLLPYYLETVADNIKISHQVCKMLKSLQRKLLKEENEQILQEEVHNAKTRCDKLLKYKKETTHFYKSGSYMHVNAWAQINAGVQHCKGTNA